MKLFCQVEKDNSGYPKFLLTIALVQRLLIHLLSNGQTINARVHDHIQHDQICPVR